MAVLSLSPTASAYVQKSALGPGGGVPGSPGAPIGFAQSDISPSNVTAYLNVGRALDLTAGQIWSAYDACVLYDTSPIGAGLVTAANLKFAFYVGGGFPHTGLGGGFFINWYAFDGTIAATDWIDFANLTAALPSPLAATVAFASWSTALDAVVVTVPLANIANINAGGTTGLRFTTGSPADGWPLVGGGTRLDQLVIYGPGSGQTAPVLEITYTPAGLCHLIPAETAGLPPVQCPETAVNANCVVSGRLLGPGGTPLAEATVPLRLSNAADWRNLGGPLGARSSWPRTFTTDATGGFAVSVPPRDSLCPLDGSDQARQFAQFTLPSGREVRVVVPDSATARLEKLLSGQVAALAPVFYATNVVFSIPDASWGTVLVRLSAPAYWQNALATFVLLDATETAVALAANGQGAIALAPQAALTGPSGATLWWEFKLPGEAGWTRAVVPDAASVDFENLVREAVEW